MGKNRLVQIFFLLLTLISGNLFWFLLANDIKAQHLLTNSPIHIALTFVLPIVVFGIYLSGILYFSIFAGNKILWFITALLSFVLYPFILGITVITVLGEIIISLAIFIFLMGYHRSQILFNGKASHLGQFYVALSGATLIISITVAVSFYNFYGKTLSQANVVLSNQGFVSTLKPVMRAYFDDLNIKDVNETFGTYLIRRSRETRTTQASVENKTLYILGIDNVQKSDTMETLINNSIKNSILKVFLSYRRQIPIVISLGLGIITQTVLSASTFIGYLFSIFILRVLIKFRLVRINKKTIETEETLSSL